MEQYPVTFEVQNLITEELWEQDDNGDYYKHWEIWDHEVVGNITVFIKEENDDCNIADLEEALRTQGFILKAVELDSTDGGLSYRVEDAYTYEPLYDLVLI